MSEYPKILVRDLKPNQLIRVPEISLIGHPTWNNSNSSNTFYLILATPDLFPGSNGRTWANLTYLDDMGRVCKTILAYADNEVELVYDGVFK